jgi:6-phosphogluconate dehydrogenase (decarboxylating)
MDTLSTMKGLRSLVIGSLGFDLTAASFVVTDDLEAWAEAVRADAERVTYIHVSALQLAVAASVHAFSGSRSYRSCKKQEHRQQEE